MFKKLFGNKTSRKSTHNNEALAQRQVQENLFDENDITLVKQISDSKFPVYLLSVKSTNQNIVGKIFPHSNEDSQTHFENELRFASLKHPNIINMISYRRNKEVTDNGEVKKFSGILMEHGPYGDLFDFMHSHKSLINDKLIRTYFRQLIEGIEFLHANGMAHLDLKPENMLIGADFNLKICDFDMSWKQGDAKVLSGGTRCYRAPEFFTSRYSSKVSFEADIYSAAVILFLLKSRGTYPHNENDNSTNDSLFDLMYKNNSQFWKRHCETQGVDASFFDSNFRELFNSMTKYNPQDRLTIRKIKKSKWYNEPVYSAVELQDIMSRMLKH